MSPIAVITGATRGIGRVTARELVRAGRTAIMLCRDLDAGRAASEAIAAEVPGARLHLVPCDLASLAAVRRAADTVKRRFGPIGILVNNAGMVSTRHRWSTDGFELTFATNHLGPFLLTVLLLEHLDPSARVINVASRAHYRGRIDFDLITNRRARYRATAAYAQSKLANVLFTFALARRLAGTARCANCLHPGVVKTHLLPFWLRLVKPLISPRMLDAERGARTTLHLALAAEVAGVSGCYFDENQRPCAAAPLAQHIELQEALWLMSARWTGVTA